jgi:hypothetical protein
MYGIDGLEGWEGAGGSFFMWLPEFQASFAYIPSKLSSRIYHHRALRMLVPFIQALKDAKQAKELKM